MSKAALAAAVCLTAAFATAQDGKPVGENWSHWRGPLKTGVSPHGNPPIEWSEEKNIRWKVAIPGKGSGSPVIWGDKLFLLTAVPAGEPAANVDSPAETEPVALLQPERSEGGDAQNQDRPRGRFGDRGRGGPGRRGGFGGGPAPTTPYEFVVMCLDRNTGKT
ncbi:MAG: hypothetical protein WBC44_05830, partial [Planctomycetaceae bacterium]